MLLVDYRLLPEHPISAPIDDVVAVVEHVVSTGDVGADRLFLAGDSSGAALAIGTTRRLRDRGGPAIAGVISLSGAFDATLSGDSIDAGHDPQITRPALEHWQQIVAAGTDPADPELSPMFASLHDLPPTLLLVGSDEVWLSDSTRLAERMAAAGSSAAVEIYDGMWHVWPMYGAFPEAVEALKRIALFVSTSS